MAPLFLVSLVAIGFEISLTRYFAVASWSEYGYWVISIALAGISASGVLLSLIKDQAVRYKTPLLLWTPMALMISGAIGYYLVTVNSFNPLELQNAALWRNQLWHIGGYYLALFPFFFIAGAYVGLYFLCFPREIPRAYAADLVGAGVGGLLTLGLMNLVHPFYLPAALMPVLAVAGTFHLTSGARGAAIRFLTLTGATLLASEFTLVTMNRAAFNEYKSIFAALHVPGSRVVESYQSPRGFFLVLDDFTERLDTDISNNARLVGAPDPPATLGLYRDGNRIAALPKTPEIDARYAVAALDAVPYVLNPGARVLLIGTRGGFRPAEVRLLGASTVLAVEPDPSIHRFVAGERTATNPAVAWSSGHPLVIAGARPGAFDIIDIASDFLAQSDANRYLFTVESIQALVRTLGEDGILSIPVAIQELPVYATKMVRTVRAALDGLRLPARTHVVVYRSAWNARVLVFRRPVTSARLDALKEFCDERSFDLSYFPGIDPRRLQVWNSLPEVSFEQETVLPTDPQGNDAVRTEAIAVVAGTFRGDDAFFDTRPATLDRPFFFAILPLTQVAAILRKIELVPEDEMVSLISVAVLGQAILFAAVVLGLPLMRRRLSRPPGRVVGKTFLYFGALGLGFLFLEILLIEKAAFLLYDRTLAFALVLVAMLCSSGLGSYYAARYTDRPRDGGTRAAIIVCVWIALAYWSLDPILAAALPWPLLVRGVVVALLVAPLGIPLGFLFPLGLTAFGQAHSRYIPWAWGINGAFSVISTPLAYVMTVEFGYRVLLVSTLTLYASVLLTFPAPRGRTEPQEATRHETMLM